MSEQTSLNAKPSKTGKLIFLAACCMVLMVVGFWVVLKHADPPPIQPGSALSPVLKKKAPVPSEKLIDYGKLKEKSDNELTALMEKRKAPYGIEKSIDMIVKPDESIKVGEETVRMKKILDDVRLKHGEIIETELGGKVKQEKPGEFGIHVVQPDENIWNIHFKLLKDYYDHKGIRLSPLSDEPKRQGYSSGVGKILKFSEYMVNVYNLKERRLDTDLNLVYPLSKIVVYNMSRVFSLLDRIDYKDVSRIEFDGETLWMPAEQ